MFGRLRGRGSKLFNLDSTQVLKVAFLCPTNLAINKWLFRVVLNLTKSNCPRDNLKCKSSYLMLNTSTNKLMLKTLMRTIIKVFTYRYF